MEKETLGGRVVSESLNHTVPRASPTIGPFTSEDGKFLQTTLSWVFSPLT